MNPGLESRDEDWPSARKFTDVSSLLFSTMATTSFLLLLVWRFGPNRGLMGAKLDLKGKSQ